MGVTTLRHIYIQDLIDRGRHDALVALSLVPRLTFTLASLRCNVARRSKRYALKRALGEVHGMS